MADFNYLEINWANIHWNASEMHKASIFLDAITTTFLYQQVPG
jgi:hypothetical protein